MGATIALDYCGVWVCADRGGAIVRRSVEVRRYIGNNFFVTGDYVVAGARGMNTNMKQCSATGERSTSLTRTPVFSRCHQHMCH